MRRRSVSVCLSAFKESVGCQGCGYRKYGSALCFHHTLENKRLKETARAGVKPEHFLSKRLAEELLAELSSCAIFCHNCHNELHFQGDHLEIPPMGIEMASELIRVIGEADGALPPPLGENET